MPAKTNEQIVNGYIDGVLSGRIVAGRLVRAACQRHRDDLREAKRKGLYFDRELANRAIDFFPLLRHTTGEYCGQPFMLYPFQMFIVWCLFGWRRSSDGMRRFRRALISLGRGNGKSPFAAGLTLLLIGFDTPLEQRAQGYTLATEKKQSRIVFDEVSLYVEHDQRLSQYIERLKSNLYIPATASTLEPLSATGKTKDGLNPHVVVVDEFHEYQEHHRKVWDKLVTALAKRRQPLLLVITTAGDENSKLWREFDTLASRVVERGNKIEADDLFAFIARIDDDDDPLEEANWPKGNPMLEFGVVKRDGLRSMAADAKIDPHTLARFTRYHCNREVRSDRKVITAEMWASGDGELPTLTDGHCHAALDWGWKNDLTALALAFPLEPIEIDGTLKRRIAVAVDCWIPESGRRNLALEPWASWIRDGWLRVTQGKITDTEAIYARLRELQQLYGIRTIACDPNNCREFGSRVQNELGIPAFWFGQAPGKYNEPIIEILSMLHEGRLLHGGNPLLAWNAQNMVLKKDARGYAMPDKERSEDKIDAIVAAAMAISEVMFAEQAPKYDYYETHDVEAG